MGGLSIGGVLGVLLVAWMVYLNSQLPETKLDDPVYALPTIIYDRNGQKVQEIYIKRRKLIQFEQLPPHLINGLVAKEDSRFFEHHGIDPLRMLKAAWINLVAMRKVQGASTLTQQTAKQFFLTPERTWTRKLKEILLALKIERTHPKQEILELYLNKVNFGDAWGVSAAAETYFGKKVEDLTLSESAMLVGLLPAPNTYKPTRSMSEARKQRNIVLFRMAEEGYITRTEQMASSAEPILLASGGDPRNEAAASYVEYVRRLLLDEYGSKNLYEGGLRVYTAMDMNYQMAAHSALVQGIREMDRRRGFRGVENRIELNAEKQIPEEVLVDLNPGLEPEPGTTQEGIVLEVGEEAATVVLSTQLRGQIMWEELREEWQDWIPNPEKQEETRPIKALADILQPGDVLRVEVRGYNPDTALYQLGLYQEPQSNGAVYAADPNTGDVLAMVGGVRYGRETGESEFIRATQALRQPGSSFKPLIYAAAMEEGYTPASVLDDNPRVITLRSGKKHTPQNYDQKFLGRVSLRESLVRSRNVPTMQLVEEMTPRKVIKYSRQFGLTTPIPEEALISLGTHSVRLSEMTRAYGVFVAGGKLFQPNYILRIEDNKGNVIMESETKGEQVISQATAFLTTDILVDVVKNPFGTGNKAMEGFNRPNGGKTGTTQNYTDAWYIGFIPQLVTGIYIGFDDPTISLGPNEAGSKAAAPVWKMMMNQIEGALPIETFQQPNTVVTMRVDGSGRMLPPCAIAPDARYEKFRLSTIPKRLRDSQGCNQPGVTVSTPLVSGGPANDGAEKPPREEEDL